MPRSVIKRCVGWPANGQRVLIVPPPPPPFWTPAEFGANNRGWWPAKSLTGLAVGDNVTTIPSSGGAVNTLTQATAGRYPLFTHVGGDPDLAAYNFDGEDDYLALGDRTITKNASKIVIAALFKFDEIDADAAPKSLISFPGVGGGTRLYLATEAVASTTKRYAFSGRALDAAGTTTSLASASFPVDTNMHVIVAWLDRTALPVKLRMFLDGTSIMDITNPSGWPVGAWDNVNEPSSANLGMRTSNAPKQSIDGSILDFLILDRLPTQDEQWRLESYFAHKGKIAGNLPNDNPYKASPPVLET